MSRVQTGASFDKATFSKERLFAFSNASAVVHCRGRFRSHIISSMGMMVEISIISHAISPQTSPEWLQSILSKGCKPAQLRIRSICSVVDKNRVHRCMLGLVDNFCILRMNGI